MTYSKEKLVDLLSETAQLMRCLGENDFKIRAYEKASDVLLRSQEDLRKIADGLVKISGIGEGLKTSIKEFLNSGTIKLYEELIHKIPKPVIELMQLPGLGPKKAMQVFKELGVQTLGELEYACRENRLLKLTGFGDALQGKILKNIEQLKSNTGKLRLDAAVFKKNEIESLLRERGIKQIFPVGALARHCEIISELEFFLVAEKSQIANLDFFESSTQTKHIVGDEKLVSISGVTPEKFMLTFWISPKQVSPLTLQWLCAHPDLRSNIEGSSFLDWEPSWLEPEWFSAHRNPNKNTYRTSAFGSVKGFFHCHTNASDGANTLEEMVKEAEKLGFEYIGISDHSQSAIYAHGLKLESILEQRMQVKELQKKVSIRIFYGVESDILGDGSLDYAPEVLSDFDFIVGSIHNRFQMDEKAMTERLVTALSNPYITIWGHPTGRLLLGRPSYLLDWDLCIKTAKENNVAIEINANAQRLDVDWRLGEKLEKSGVAICINPDAHNIGGLKHTQYGEWMAEKAMLNATQILNLKNVSEMEKYLWERKKVSKSYLHQSI